MFRLWQASLPLTGLAPSTMNFNCIWLRAAEFIDNSLKDLTTVPLSLVLALIDTIAEFYASGPYLQETTQNTREQPNIVLAEKKPTEYKHC